jgi:hypothetical protein
VAAPEGHREKLGAHAMRMAAKRIAAAAKNALAADAETAVGLAKVALSIEPKAADAHAALGFAQRPTDPKAPAAEWKKAIDPLRAALAPDAVWPLPDDERTAVMSELGGYLLQTNGDEAVNREARDLLEKAWQAAHKQAPEKGGWVGPRYNLACAYARLKDKDKAFEHLHGVLDFTVKTPVRGVSGWWLKDPDFDVLKDDPRWKATVEKYPDSTSPDGGGSE